MIFGEKCEIFIYIYNRKFALFPDFELIGFTLLKHGDLGEQCVIIKKQSNIIVK